MLLKISIPPNYECCDFLAENIDDPTLKSIAKWRNQQHQNIEIEKTFNFVSKEEVVTEVKVLDFSKVVQESDIPGKIINENFFAMQFVFILTNHQNMIHFLQLLFYKQSIFDPCPENCLSFSKKSHQKIVQQLFSR